MHPNPPDQGSVHNLDDRRAGTDQPAANRAAKKQENRAKYAAQKAERKKANAAKAASKQPKCTGKNKAGLPCRSFAVKDGLCRVHSASEEEYEILMEQARAVRRQAKVKPHELMRQVIESNPIAFMQPYLDSLGIRVIS